MLYNLNELQIINKSWNESKHPRDTKGEFSTVKELSEHYRRQGVANDVHHSERTNNISLSRIVVPKEHRGKGTGSKYMGHLTDIADRHGSTVTLTPSKDFGGSVPRLKEFYKRHGFVENKGRNKDLSISDTMYRLPKAEKSFDLEKAVKGTTKTHAKKLHKELPAGGVWRTMNGHHIYILNGQIIAGASPTAKGDSLKKMDKKTVGEHQNALEAEAKEAKKKAAAKKKADKLKAQKAKEKDEKANAKAPATKINEPKPTAVPNKKPKAKAGTPAPIEPPKVEHSLKPKKPKGAQTTKQATNPEPIKLVLDPDKAPPAKKKAAAKKPAPAPEVKAPEPIKGDGVVNGSVKGGTAVDNGDGTVTFTYTGIQGGKMGTHSKVIKKEKFTAHAEPAPASEAPKAEPKPKKAAKPKAPKKPALDLSNYSYQVGSKFAPKMVKNAEHVPELDSHGTHVVHQNEHNSWHVSNYNTKMAVHSQAQGTKEAAIDKAKELLNQGITAQYDHDQAVAKKASEDKAARAKAKEEAEKQAAKDAKKAAKKAAKPKAPAQPKAEEKPEFVTAKHSGTADNKPKFNVAKNAEALPEMEGIQSFVHEIPGNQWIVSEKSTGIMLSGNPMSDKQNAIDYAKSKIAKMPDYLKMKIQDTKDEHGDIEANKDKIMPELGSGAGDGSGKMTPAQQKFAEHAKKKFEAAIMDKEDIATGINHALGYLSQDEKDALKQYHMDGNASLMTGDTWSHLAPTLSNIKQIKAEQAKIEAEKKKAEIEAAQKDAAEKQKKADKELYEKIEPHKIDEAKEKDDHYELYHGTSIHVLSNIINNGFKLHGLSSDFGHCAYFKSPEFDPKESHSGNGTKAITGFFAKSNPVYIKAYIHKSHVLDLSKGEPSELKQMKSEFSGNMHGTGQKKLALKYLAGVDTTSLSYGEIDDQYNKLQGSMPPHQLGAFTPYEAYCKKNGLKGIVGVLPDYKSEGWQFGVYDTSALKIHDWGKAITQTGPDSVALIKAIDTGKKAVPPYALMKVSMDGDHYVLHVAALDDVSDMEKSLFTVRSMMTW